MFAYKTKFPDQLFLLHEKLKFASITKIYGFYEERKRRYNIKTWKHLCWHVFSIFPVCGLVDEKIMCMRGGLSP